MKSAEAIPLITPDPIMVRVTAPSNLAGGYKFDAVFNGEVFPVTVPAGGVRSGQSFEVPFVPAQKAVAVATVVQIPEDDNNNNNESTPMLQATASHNNKCTGGNCTAGGGNGGNNHNNRPLGKWKTGLCDCLEEGCFHPSAVNAWFCPQILMAQVLTRMKLDFCGSPSGDSYRDAYKTTTATWIIATAVVWYLKYLWKDCTNADTDSSPQLETLKILVDDDGNAKILGHHHIDIPYIDDSHCTKSMRFNLNLLNWIWMWTTVLVLARLRQAVRNANGIAGHTPMGFFEDLLCAFYCGCCTVSQLARETANYGTERAYYLSSTGMADEWTEHFEAFEQRHKNGHHLVHAHPAGDQPHTHDNHNHNNNETTTDPLHTHIV